MSNQQRSKLAARAAAIPGVRFAQRPATATTPVFDLAYARSGPPSPTPVVIIPGGPGLASVLPYHGLRRRAAHRDMDVLMVEHRGVGLSRTDASGTDLPVAAMSVRAVADDIAAVLDGEGVEQAIIYGSSYGSYVAQAFGAWHPGRVAGMVLDSATIGAHSHHAVRTHARELLWEGRTVRTARAAWMLRRLVYAGVVGTDEGSEVARIVYEFAGTGTLERLLDAKRRLRAERTWGWVAGLGQQETTSNTPFVMEFDLVGHIAFTELNYAPEPDGGPFDPATSFTSLAEQYPPFAAEPVDVPKHWARFDWPVAVLAGERDLRTPRVVAEQIVAAVPDGVLIPLADTGHSALDTHGLAALRAIEAVRDGDYRALTDGTALAELRRLGASRHLSTALRLGLRAEGLLPGSARRA